MQPRCGSQPNQYSASLLLDTTAYRHPEHRSVRNIVLSNWADTIYPKVTYVDASLVRLPLTRSLAAAMPNLTNLRVEDTYGDAGKLFDVPTASRRRAENTDTSLSKDAPNWSRLDCVTGPIVDVFSLGLTCPVSRLCLHTNERCDVDCVMLASTLQFAPGLSHLQPSVTEQIFGTDGETIHIEELKADKTAWDALTEYTRDELGNTIVRILSMLCTPELRF